MKKLGLLLILLLVMVACTPTSEDNTLPTRVILPTDAELATESVIDPLETATESVIDPLETATESVIDPLETATESVIDPLETATESVIDPLESATESVIDPLPQANIPAEAVTESVIDPLESATESVIDPLGSNNPPPIVIPPLQQTQPPVAVPTNNLNVVMPTFDLSNLPTSVPTATPYPLVETFANLTESTQVVRLKGIVEIMYNEETSDDIYLLRDVNNFPVELIWDYETIDNLPGRGQTIEAIGTIRSSLYPHASLILDTISIIPVTLADESG